MTAQSAWPGVVLKYEGVDAIHDLKCVAATTTSSTYNTARSTENVRRICDWFDYADSLGIDATLKVSRGSVAINSTLGIRTHITAANTGTLSTRTSDTAGTLTLQTGHGVLTGDIISITWSGGSTHYATVGTVSGNSVPFTNSLSYGPVLPAQSTAATAYRIVGVPDSINIYCGGGFPNGYYHVNRNNYNEHVGSFMWTGDAYSPVIRLLEGGNKITANIWGYTYVTGDNPPTIGTSPVSRGQSAIDWYQLPSFPACGHHTLSDCTFSGFKQALRFISSDNHCDHIHGTRITFRDCLEDIYCENNQSLGHHWEFIEHYCPGALHSTVLNYYRGGRMTCNKLLITGDYGFTVFKSVGTQSNPTGSNGADFTINGLGVDKGTTNATSGSTYRDNVIASGGSKETFTASSSSGLLLTTGTTYDTGQAIWLTNSGGGLPTGVSAGTIYYAINVSATTCRVAASRANAFAGTQIAYTDAGTGTHSIGRVMYTETVDGFTNSGGNLLCEYDTDITTGQTILFHTGTTLPTGLTAGTTYYAIRNSATTCFIATSQDNALAGTKIVYTNAGSGSHCITRFNSYAQLYYQDPAVSATLVCRMQGHIAYSGGDVTTTPFWGNYNGEDLVSAAVTTDTGATRKIELDVTGIDDVTARKYSPNQQLSTTAAGSNYALTATPALLNFGTTDPTITLFQKGTWIVGGWVRLYFNGFTAGASRTATFKVRRTTATAADITDVVTGETCTTSLITGAIAAQTRHYCDVKLPEVKYRTDRENVVIELFGSVDSVSGDTGTFECSGAQLTARRYI